MSIAVRCSAAEMIATAGKLSDDDELVEVGIAEREPPGSRLTRFLAAKEQVR